MIRQEENIVTVEKALLNTSLARGMDDSQGATRECSAWYPLNKPEYSHGGNRREINFRSLHFNIRLVNPKCPKLVSMPHSTM